MKKSITIGCFLFSLFALMMTFVSCKKEEPVDSRQAFQVESYYPNSGKAGTLVTILGTGFQTDRSVYTVNFGMLRAEVLRATSDELVVRAPEGTGSHTISLSDGIQSLTVGEYRYQTLSVQGLSPVRAQQGAQIRVLGEGFGGLASPAEVTINDKLAKVVSATDTVLEVVVPEDAGSGSVRVSVDGMDAQGPNFTFMVIRSMKPLTGGAGTRITLDGEGFEETVAGNTVAINGIQGTILEASSTQLVVQAAAGVETGQLIVWSDDSPINGPVFTVVSPPSISLVTPLYGPAGTEVVIQGSSFSPETGETLVRINGREMPLTSVSATEIRLTVPAGTGRGNVEVIVNDQLTAGPVFSEQDLSIVSFSPANGISGTVVTITGVGFSTNPGDNQVSFNGVSATVTAATTSSLTVVAPVGLTTGLLRVSVDGYEAFSSDDFHRAGVETLGAGQLNVSSGGSLAVDGQGNVYVLEIGQHRIKRITPDGQVSLFVGSAAGAQGYQNGQGQNALFRFSENSGIVVDAQDNLYVTDSGNQSLRKISPQGDVTTFFDGFGVNDIGKVAINENGHLLVVTPETGAATTRQFFVFNPAAMTYQIRDMQVNTALDVRFAMDLEGNFYFRRNASGYFTRISRYRVASTSGWTHTAGWAGNTTAGFVDATGTAARFDDIYGFVRYDADYVLVLDANNRALRLANINTAAVSTLLSFSQGYEDGDFRAARFSNTLRDINIGPDGTVYILDSGNNAVRKVFFR